MKLPGRDLVAERLADLGDAERRLLAREAQDGLEVQEDALRGLGAQVDRRAGLLHGADRRLEHEVELARLGEVALGRLARVLGRLAPARRARSRWSARKRWPQVRQSTSGSVKPARWPLASHVLRVLDDRRVERDDVVAIADHRLPPRVDDVALEQHAVVAVVVGVRDPAVDLRGGEDRARAACTARRSCPWSRRRRPCAASYGAALGGAVWHSYTQSAMPIYEYRCENGHQFEVMQKMTDDPVPSCTRATRRSSASSTRSRCTSRARASTTPTTARSGATASSSARPRTAPTRRSPRPRTRTSSSSSSSSSEKQERVEEVRRRRPSSSNEPD